MHNDHECEEHKNIVIRICLSVLFFIIGFWCTPFFVLAYLLAGFDIIYLAIKNIFKGEVFDENFLMSMATIGAICLKEYPEAVMVMILYQLGEFLQHTAVHKSQDSIEALMNIRPDFAWKNGVKVSPEDINAGDIITVNTGEKIPLDGIITEGSASVDISALTGESIPVYKKAGNEILSGSINLNGCLKIKVTNEYSESTVNKILKLIESSAGKKAKTEKFITKFAKIYTPVVVMSAVIIGCILPIIIHIYTGEDVFRFWFERALTFLVISCPCALVISIPLTFFAGIGGASSKGILVKGGNYLEQLSKIDTIVFDKTGTLTQGVFKVQEVCSDNIYLIKYAAIAESSSNHPIAVAIKKAYNKELPRIINIEEYAGEGVIANYENNIIKAGTAKFIGVEAVKNSETIVYISINNVYQGYIVVSDKIKDDTIDTIKRLRNSGIKTAILTGDTKEKAQNIQDITNTDEVYAELLPQDKVKILESIMEHSAVTAFVGDGINDAPVLKRADIGIAMGGLGSDAAIEASDAVIMDDKLFKIITAIQIAKKTMSIAKQNIIFAIGIKVLFLILGGLGFMTMWGAVFADTGVALASILNALRAKNIKEN